MKSYRIEPTDKALVDAGEAYFWINEQSEGGARRASNYRRLFQEVTPSEHSQGPDFPPDAGRPGEGGRDTQ